MGEPGGESDEGLAGGLILEALRLMAVALGGGGIEKIRMGLSLISSSSAGYPGAGGGEGGGGEGRGLLPLVVGSSLVMEEVRRSVGFSSLVGNGLIDALREREGEGGGEEEGGVFVLILPLVTGKGGVKMNGSFFFLTLGLEESLEDSPLVSLMGSLLGSILCSILGLGEGEILVSVSRFSGLGAACRLLGDFDMPFLLSCVSLLGDLVGSGIFFLAGSGDA
jgi:hypothetical protein